MPVKISNLGLDAAAPSVICWSYHPSHVLNLARIPRLLAARGWTVRCLHPFGEDGYVGERADGVQYHFGVPFDTLAQLRSDVYLSPFVGQDRNFPQGATRVHFLVSLDGIEGVYDPVHFDHYDVIALAGTHHVAEFEAHARRRGWTGKTLLPVGYPKLDSQRRRAGTTGMRPAGDTPTVVFAPTHAYHVNRQYSVLATHGAGVVDGLLRAGLRVIFRPHPESWKDQDRAVVDRIVGRHQANDLFEVDLSRDYFDTYARSDAIVTDVSGTGFTFAFTFGRPAVYFAPDESLEIGKTGIQYESREEIGYVARKVEDITGLVATALGDGAALRARIESFRDRIVFNSGSSERYFVDWITATTGTSPGSPG